MTAYRPTLPAELWLKVYSYLSPRTCFFVIPSVCALWRRLLLDPEKNKSMRAAAVTINVYLSRDVDFSGKFGGECNLCNSWTEKGGISLNTCILSEFVNISDVKKPIRAYDGYPSPSFGLRISMTASVDVIWKAFYFEPGEGLSTNSKSFIEALRDELFKRSNRLFELYITQVNIIPELRMQSAQSVETLRSLLTVLSPFGLSLNPLLAPSVFPPSLKFLHLERISRNYSLIEVSQLRSLQSLRIGPVNDLYTMPSLNAVIPFSSFSPLLQLQFLSEFYLHSSIRVDNANKFCTDILLNMHSLESLSLGFLKDGFGCSGESIAKLLNHPSLKSIHKISHPGSHMWSKLTTFEDMSLLSLPSPAARPPSSSTLMSPPYSYSVGSPQDPVGSPTISHISPYSPPYPTALSPCSSSAHTPPYTPQYNNFSTYSPQCHFANATSSLQELHLEYADVTISDLISMQKGIKEGLPKLRNLVIEYNMSGYLQESYGKGELKRWRCEGNSVRKRRKSITGLANSEDYATLEDLAIIIVELLLGSQDMWNCEEVEGKPHAALKTVAVHFIGEIEDNQHWYEELNEQEEMADHEDGRWEIDESSDSESELESKIQTDGRNSIHQTRCRDLWSEIVHGFRNDLKAHAELHPLIKSRTKKGLVRIDWPERISYQRFDVNI